MTLMTDLNVQRIAEMVLGLDRLTRDIPAVVGKLRSAEAGELARSLPVRSQALRLAIAMDQSPQDLLSDAQELERGFRRLQGLAIGTRIPATGRLALMLGLDLAAELVVELRQ